ncbi:MAG: TlpA disulfide reductase family protein [Saprospiraceae bacterium]
MPGIWRGSLILNDSRQIIVTRNIYKVVTRDVHPESMQIVIPFNFNVVYTSDQDFYIEIINNTERIKFDGIKKGRDMRTGNDTMVISLKPYAAEIKCIYENNKMSGEYIVLDKQNYSIPFTASYGHSYRFEKIQDKTDQNISGTWQAIFEKDSIDEYNAIGEFKQDGNLVNGTFRTETGDYRFLSGEISANKLKLSTFDGAHAYLFLADIVDSMMFGTFYSGKNYSCYWEAKRTDEVHLISPDSVTKLINNDPLIFNFENTDGKWVSNTNPQYQNKYKIIQISGTWCPNCRDETEFIKNFIQEHPQFDVPIFAIEFERYHDRIQGIKRIAQYKKDMKIPYEVLLGGNNNKDSSSLFFPQLGKIESYPTLLFLNKDNRIIKIHTGFNGPATSKFLEFKKEFDETVSKMK